MHGREGRGVGRSRFHPLRGRARDRDRRRPLLSGHPVRGGAGRAPPLPGAAAGAGVEGRARRLDVRSDRAAAGVGARQLLPRRSARPERGLPRVQRVGPGGSARTASGHGVRPRRGLLQRERFGSHVPGRPARGPRRRRRHLQLPARRARLPRPPGARRRGEWRARQLGSSRPGRRSGLGAGQHPGLRGRPFERHRVRRVGRGDVDLRPARCAVGAGTVPACHRRERRSRSSRRPRRASPNGSQACSGLPS